MYHSNTRFLTLDASLTIINVSTMSPDWLENFRRGGKVNKKGHKTGRELIKYVKLCCSAKFVIKTATLQKYYSYNYCSYVKCNRDNNEPLCPYVMKTLV